MSSRIRDYLPTYRNWLAILLGALSLLGLYAISRHNFLLFHCLAEAFSIIIAIAVFAIFWNTRQYLDNGIYLIIGFGCLFAGILDVIYIFAYPGMSVFPGAYGNIALQAKTVAQWFVSLSCIAAFPFLRRKIDQNLALAVYSALTALALGSIFYWRVFPDCYREGVGQTSFERIGLMISCIAYLGAIGLLIGNRREFDSRVFKFLAATLILLFVEDLASAAATDINGFARTLAHLCQVVALCFVYKAFVEVGLRRPYDLLFRGQQRSGEELRLALEALRETQERLTLAVNIGHIGIFDWNVSTGKVTWNQQQEVIFGYPPGAAAATIHDHQDWADRVHPDDLPWIKELIGRAMAERTPYQMEHRVVWPDGSIHWITAQGRAYYDAQGRPARRLGTVMDITDRKRAEEALRASEERYRLLVETIPQLAWRLSPDGMDVECNRRWYEYTGQTPDQVRAHGWLAAVHPEDLFRVFERALHAANTKDPYELEYRLRRASDDSYRWHLARAVPVLGEDGRVTCWIGSNTDIEELKQAQEILKHAHDEQLQRHQAELAHVARLSTMGEMAASLAHELNQPLHAVKNYAYGSICRLQKMQERDEEFVVALEQISEEASRAAEIIRRVMAFVQKRETRFSEVAVNGLVEDAVLLSQAELGRRHATMVLELAADLPSVMGDAIQIEQVIMNLVRNGLEAMEETPEDNRHLAIKTLRDGDHTIQVDVSDCGKGIAGADLEKVFEPFFTTKPEGMGMGLAICRSIVQSHGGHVWGTANKVRGCTFHFTLPIGKGI